MTQEDMERCEELNAKARAKFMAVSQNDFQPEDWLNEEEAKEYNKLFPQWIKEVCK